MKKFINVFTTTVLALSMLIVAFVAGLAIGKVAGYDQRRDAEISMSRMLVDRQRAVINQRY